MVRISGSLTPRYPIYKWVIAHLLTIDRDFLGSSKYEALDIFFNQNNGQQTHISLVMCIYIKNLDEQVRKNTNGCLVSMGGWNTAQFFHQVGVCANVYMYICIIYLYVIHLNSTEHESSAKR